MNWKIFLCIAMGVFVAHIAFFMLLFHFRTDGAPLPPPPPPRNFRVAEEHVVDPATGEKIVHRELRVSTRLVPGGYESRNGASAAK